LDSPMVSTNSSGSSLSNKTQSMKSFKITSSSNIAPLSRLLTQSQH
jgi:hypothetical protein